MISNQSSVIRLACMVCVAVCLNVYAADDAALIPESRIRELEEQFRDGVSGGARSGVASRRAFKNTIRKGLSLVEKYPEAPNRFPVLGLVVQCQKRMFAIDATDRNREALFETCEQLIEAPDKYAEERLEADLLLSDRDLSAKDATLAERSEALAELIGRYVGTKAEARSLLMGALIVQKLDNRELESEILYALDEKYSDDHEVIEFRRKFLKISRLDLVFSGSHRRVDGSELIFPADTAGHMSIMLFWSKNKPGIDKYLEATKAALTNAPGQIDVFSFNVDGLPDGGESVLKKHGLDWTVMRLPGGRESQAYRSYAQGDPMAVLVNEYGTAVTRPEIVHGRSSAVDATRISDDRYMVQLQSLLIGDFLVWAEKGKRPGSNLQQPASKLDTINECFVAPPFRYRLTGEEALENYARASTICEDLLAEEEDSSPLWQVRNARIIALIGMWNQGRDPKALERAVTDAKKALGTGLPEGGDVIPRFCLAKASLREGGDDLETIVRGFIEECGGKDAPASALAAASILSIDARSRPLHEEYRAAFLEKHSDDPEFYAFSSFLRDRHHQYRLLKANHTLRERRARGYIVGHGYPWPTNSLPDLEFKNLDGSKFTMPKDTNGKLTYLMFVEPPTGGRTNNWYLERDSRGNIRRASGVISVMGYANQLSTTHINNDINFVAAFLTEDAEHVEYLVQTNGWKCRPVMVPGGLSNPMVRQLGIVSGDRFPNVFLLRRDGTIAWHGSGLRYKNEFGYPFAVLLAMKVHVEVCEMEHGYKALVRGDYKDAVRIFSGPFPAGEPQRYAWRPVRYHAKALAHAGMKDWDGALDSIQSAIDAHKLRHFRGYGRRGRIEDWRKDAAKVEIKEPCDVICGLWRTKADILEKLGRKEEAADLRKRGEKPAQEHYSYVYEQFHAKLHDLNLVGK